MAILSTNELTRRFGQHVVLDHLNLDVPEGAIFALIGSNGTGKTTTIKTLMNILQPSGGSATVLGKDSRKLGADDFARIGYVSENQELPGWMSIEYFLRYLKPFYPTWDDATAAALLRQFDLPADRKLKDLSRGMWMKAALTSSLCYRPELIVLDEPFSGLDPLVREEFVEAMLEHTAGATTLISSHDLAEIETFSSHIGYLENGRIQFAEELASLTARFREVEVTFEAEPVLPAAWPAEWLKPRTSAAVLRFVETRFDAERTPARLRELFPGIRQVEIRALPLREIFIALAKASRKAAA